ncbi:MAG: hypothetical protein ABS52_00170 [Gemmatimonadetes bacterium SCN 70-22]|nr:MAG: hypothetical protein ABS52_00170 [Gemmatimonadetes bacterium SCN 70-22]
MDCRGAIAERGVVERAPFHQHVDGVDPRPTVHPPATPTTLTFRTRRSASLATLAADFSGS